MPTSIWTHAERAARQAIEAALRERDAAAPDEFWSFYRRWGPACVLEALDTLQAGRGEDRLKRFVREAVARHFEPARQAA